MSNQGVDALVRALDALDKVRELHKPFPEGHYNHPFCQGCEFSWPCPTWRIVSNVPERAA